MIWSRYILKELAKIFFLAICAFYFLYVLIDYATHTKNFSQEGLTLSAILTHYLKEFLRRADVLVPIALLVSVIKVFTHITVQRELVALLAGGVPLKKLLRPFILFGVVCTAALYLNPLPDNPTSTLADGSVLIRTPQTTYWYRTSDLIYKMDSLTLSPPTGYNVEKLARQDGEIRKVATYDHFPFPDMPLDAPKLSGIELMKRLLTPLTCLLVIIAPAPFCLRFSRHTPIFFLYAFSLFGIIAFFTCVNAALILGIGLVPLFVLLFGFFGWRYARL